MKYPMPLSLCHLVYGTEDAASHLLLGIDTCIAAGMGSIVLEKRLKNMKKKEEI